MKPHFIFWYTKKMRKRIVIQTYICIWIVAMKLLNLRIIKRPLKHKFIGCLKEYKALFGPVLETKKHQIIHPILEPHKDSNIWNHRIFWFLILRLMLPVHSFIFQTLTKVYSDNYKSNEVLSFVSLLPDAVLINILGSLLFTTTSLMESGTWEFRRPLGLSLERFWSYDEISSLFSKLL